MYTVTSTGEAAEVELGNQARKKNKTKKKTMPSQSSTRINVTGVAPETTR